MKRILPAALLALAAVACSGSSEDNKGKSGKGKAAAVRIGSLGAGVPKDWKEEKPQGSFRAYQLRLSSPDGDAEVIVFRGIGGSAEANVDRWKKQFTPPEGKKADEAIRITPMRVGGYRVLTLDASGTYNSDMAFGPQPDYRMVGVCSDAPEFPSQIVLRGPAKTVAKFKKEFDDWLQSFK